MSLIQQLLLWGACLISSLAYAHDGAHAEQGVWHKIPLIVKWDSNWPTEHCIEILESLVLKYSWVADSAMKYDLHVHPNNKNNEYQTNYFSKSDSIKAEVGEVITKKPGTYCFNFDPVKRLTSNGKIELSYLLD